jgi:radical SAM protein with 4Fe4S-binding SPASM domain
MAGVAVSRRAAERPVEAGGTPVGRLSYAEFTERLWPRIAAERTPLDGSLELTFRCNLRCAHCYVNTRRGDRRARRQELTAAEIRRIAGEAADLGCLTLLLTGGEPLLRADLPDIYRHLKSQGFLVALFTNGTLVTERFADLLADRPPLVVEITLYGATAEVYERVTGVPGSHRRCLRGIELLLDRKVRVRLKTVPLTINVSEMDAMRALASAYGVAFHWDPLVNCRLDGSPEPTRLRLQPEQIVALERGEPKRIREYREHLVRAEGVTGGAERFDCNAFRHSFHIDPSGRMMPCMLVRHPVYDVRAGSFREGWTEAFPVMRRQPRTRANPCQGCRLTAVCGQCAGWAQLETGDPEDRVPFLCDLANARAAAFGASRQPPGQKG